MQKIDNIEIKNFKSIRHQKIEGCKKINVFIGYPNVGKSNIIEALSLFCYLNQEQDLPLESFVRFRNLIDLFSDGDKQKDAEIFTNENVFALRYIDKNFVDAAIISRDKYVEKFNSNTTTLKRNLQFDKNGGIQISSRREYSTSISCYLLKLCPGLGSSTRNSTKLVAVCSLFWISIHICGSPCSKLWTFTIPACCISESILWLL